MRLCIINHKPHWFQEGKLVSSGGIVAEIDYWATLFDKVVLCVPLHKDEQPPAGVYSYRMPNIEVAPLPPFRANLPGPFIWRFRKSYRFLMNVIRLFKMIRAILSCDAVCIRGPGKASMLGLIAAFLTRKRRCARYGGNWSVESGSPSERREKVLLKSKWFRGPVFVQGHFTDLGGDHVSAMSGTTVAEAHVQHTRDVALGRELGLLPRLLFVGRLSEVKNVDDILRAMAILRSSGHAQLSLDICGDGVQRSRLEKLAVELGLESIIRFCGMVPLTEMGKYYETADILLLASSSEGWPKALHEGMLYGLPCIATPVGAVPEIVGEDERGILWPVGEVQRLAEAIVRLIEDPDLYKRMSRAARAWAEQYTLERYRDQVGAILEAAWRCKLKRELVPPVVSGPEGH